MSAAIHPHLRRALIRALLTAAVLSGLLAAVPTAQAGQYRVYFCRTPTGQALNLNYPGDPAAWGASDSGVGAAAVEECAKGGNMGLFLGGNPYEPATVPAGRYAQWTYLGPHPSSIVIRRKVDTRPAGDNQATPQYAFYAGGAIRELCAAMYSCFIGDPDYSDARSVAGYSVADVWGLYFRAECSGNAGGACGLDGSPRVNAQIRAIEMVYDDSTAPDNEPAYGSVLTGGEVQGGVKRIGFAATDWGGGLYEVGVAYDGVEYQPRLRIGGCEPYDRAGGIPSFTRLRECASSRDVSFDIDTRKVPDGAHTMQVYIYDVAGNRHKAAERDVVLDNVPPPTNLTKPAIAGPGVATGIRPGDQLSAQNGSWRAEPGVTFAYRWQRFVDGGFVDISKATGATYSVGADDVGHTLRVAVTASDAQGSSTAFSEPSDTVRSGATIQTQSVDPGAVTTKGAQLVVDREQRTVDVRHGAKIVITGRLVDEDGQPIANAQVDVFEQIATTAAEWKPIGTIKTDSQGGYAFRPRTTASRRLRFAYADTRGAGDYRATREVFVSVTAAMTIRTKHHVLNRHGVIRIKGKVVVDNLPATGAWVDVQVLDAGVWRTVATRRTSRTGLWVFKHRLRQSAGITFKFRGRLRPAGDVASAEAKSAPVRVRVR